MGGYTLKEVGGPEYYVGGDIKCNKSTGRQRKTKLSEKTFIKNICDKIKQIFNTTLRDYCSPYTHPELDMSDMYNKEEVFK